MSISATLLLLTTVSGAPSGDITPASLSVKPRDVDLGEMRYDWRLQQGPGATGINLELATETAHCNTIMGQTNGGKDTVPDCGFD
jgi:hypothetical protein